MPFLFQQLVSEAPGGDGRCSWDYLEHGDGWAILGDVCELGGRTREHGAGDSSTAARLSWLDCVSQQLGNEYAVLRRGTAGVHRSAHQRALQMGGWMEPSSGAPPSYPASHVQNCFVCHSFFFSGISTRLANTKENVRASFYFIFSFKKKRKGENK